jgi:DNA-binding transcriptional MerR regulator
VAAVSGSERRRPHLSIGEVLSLLQEEFPDVTISKIRFLESQGLLDPERTPSGYRKFYDGDIKRLRWILRQQKENFLPLKVIRDRLERGDTDDDGAGDPTGPVPTAEAPTAPASAPVEAAAPAGAAVPDPAPAQTGPDPAPASPAPSGAAGRVASSPDAGAALLDVGETSVSLTADELAHATGLTARQVEELERYGLLTHHRLGDDRFYDEESLVVGRIAASFLRLGVEARHLRMYKVAAEREAGVYEQLVLPRLRARRAGGRQEAMAVLSEVADLGDQLHGALLRRSLRDSLRPG